MKMTKTTRSELTKESDRISAPRFVRAICWPLLTGVLCLSEAAWAQNNPLFGIPRLDTSKTIHFILRLDAGAHYAIEMSSNLVDWVVALTDVAAGNSVELEDSTDGTAWFYRARLVQTSVDSTAINGVWMAFVPLFISSDPSPRWCTFFDNGQAFTDIPWGGLAGFDRSASQADPNQQPYWGTYTYQNGSGTLVKPGVINSTRIQGTQPDQINLDTDTYYHCANVDALRLDGAWTSSSDPAADLDLLPIGQRPIFRFRKDGSFTDEGVFATILSSFGDPAQDVAGSGVYEIRDFTVLLSYADGHVKRAAFTGFLGANPSTDNNYLYIARTQFQKMP